MLTRFKTLLVLGGIACLSGCGVLFGDDGVFRDASSDYVKSEELPEIRVPEGYDKSQLHELYAIPAVQEDSLDEVVFSDTPRPDPLASSQQDSSVKIQKLYEKRWILVSAPPSEVWPRVRNFLNVTGLAVASADAHQGIIETAWLQFKNDPEHKDKYRIRLEQGVQIDSTEVHIRHVTMTNEVAEKTTTVTWPETSTNAEREGWMVDELAGAIAADMKQSGSSSLLAQTIAGQEKVVIDITGREPVLSLNLDFNRAWATLHHAMGEEGFTLWGENIERKVFYVGYRKPEPEGDEEPGFWGRLFGGDDKADRSTAEKTLPDVLAALPEDLVAATPAAGTNAVPGYLVIVTEDAGRIDVRIRDTAAGQLKRQEARRLLTIIRRNLI